MSAVEHLRLVEAPGAAAEPASVSPTAQAASASAFTRVIATPAAWPWRQRQMAWLDARLGAPLPLDQVQLRLQRLDPWRSREGARFAATYTRAAPGTRAANVLPFGVVLNVEQGVFARRWGPLVLAGLLALGLISAAANVALDRRAQTDDALTALEQRAAIIGRGDASLLRRKAQAVILARLGAQTHSPARVLDDLAWVTNHHAPAIQVEGFHWLDGVSAVEVVSDQPPFHSPDRKVERAARPLRPGVWLWGVERSEPAANAMQP